MPSCLDEEMGFAIGYAAGTEVLGPDRVQIREVKG